jgi:hypothetical protein
MKSLPRRLVTSRRVPNPQGGGGLNGAGLPGFGDGKLSRQFATFGLSGSSRVFDKKERKD